MKLKSLAVLALATLLTVPALAADDDAKKERKGKKGAANRSAAAALLKRLEPVGLTEEQTAKITEMGKALAKASKAIREEAKLTNEIMKKRTAAMKEIREEGKVKGKDVAKAVNEKAGLNEAQTAAIAKTSELRAKFQKDVVGMLTDDQKAKLPKQMQRGAKAGAKGKGKKKKKDAA